MDYKIVLDSCGELTYKMKESGIYHTAVLSMLVDGDTILDDESFDRKDFLKRVAVSPECPKSSVLRRMHIWNFQRRSGEEAFTW